MTETKNILRTIAYLHEAKQQNLASKEAGIHKVTPLPHKQFLDTESPKLTMSGHRQAQNG